MTVVVVARDRYYVDVRYVDAKAIRELYEVPYPNKKQCRASCRLASDRKRFCSTCPGKDARIRLWDILRVKGRKIVALPTGRPDYLARAVPGGVRIVDKRPRIPFRSQLRWTGHLYRKGEVDRYGNPRPDQYKMVGDFIRAVRSGATGGLIISPPRSGKCLTGDAIVSTSHGLVTIRSVVDRHVRGSRDDFSAVGDFGKIATPYGERTIRAVHVKTTDALVRIETRLGAVVEGTPEHPILARLDGAPEAWVPLAAVARAHRVSLAYPTTTLVSPTSSIQGELLESIAAALFHQTLSDDLVARLAASSHATWRGLVKHWLAKYTYGRSISARAVVSMTAPVALAVRLHVILLSQGVEASLSRRGATATLRADHADWVGYIDGRVRAPVHDTVAVAKRLSVTSGSLPEPVRVYDLTVEGDHCYVANGVSCHNTVIGVATSSILREATFITASQIDFLRQFGRRFGEGTNLRKLYRAGQRPVVLIDKKGWPDGPKYGVHVLKKWGPEALRADVVLAVYQQFLNTDNGRERMARYLMRRRSIFIGDEIHMAAAPAFSRVANRIDVRVKLGLTATPDRVDKLEKVVDLVLGPTQSIGRVTAALPNIVPFETGVQAKHDYKRWDKLVAFLTKLPERNSMIVRQTFKDLRADERHSVLITTERREHVFELVKMFNAQAEYNRRFKREDWPTELAVGFLGGADTNAVLNMATAGQVRVVVAMSKMVRYGLDVDRWTHVWANVVPTSNAPNVYQLGNRVCTPYTEETQRKFGDKPQPVIRYVIDAMSASVFCFSKVFQAEEWGLDAGITGQNRLGIKRYAISDVNYKKLRDIALYPRSYSPSDSGVEKVLGRTRKGKMRTGGSWKPMLSGLTRL